MAKVVTTNTIVVVEEVFAAVTKQQLAISEVATLFLLSRKRGTMAIVYKSWHD